MYAVLLIIATLFTTPAPPVGFQLIQGDGVVSVIWTQQSDANVVCVEQLYRGAASSYGCMESIASPRAFTIPAPPPGAVLSVHEWRRAPDNTWISYGAFGHVVVPFRVLLPTIRQ